MCFPVRIPSSLAAFLVLALVLSLARSVADGALVAPPAGAALVARAVAEPHTVVPAGPLPWLTIPAHVASHPYRGPVPGSVRSAIRAACAPRTLAESVDAAAPFALSGFADFLERAPALVFGIWPDVPGDAPSMVARMDPATADSSNATSPTTPAIERATFIPTAPPLARPEPRSDRRAEAGDALRALGVERVESAAAAPHAGRAIHARTTPVVPFELLVQAVAFGMLGLVLIVPSACAGMAPRLAA